MTDTAKDLQRPSVTEMDALLGKKLGVLDDGFIRVVDYMGDDSAIVQAARVSYGAGTKRVNEDRGLLRYLMRHGHTSPFEMCEIKLHVRVPMDCWRQWIRHRTANVNEYSTRYSVAIDAAQKTPSNTWRRQSTANRQGSDMHLPHNVGEHLSARESDLHNLSRGVYEERLNLDVAREQARKDLPLSSYTEAYWKIDLHNLLHFLRLRMDPHAQWEIRQYADLIGHEIVSRWCPMTWEAFKDYQLRALSFSELEARIIRLLFAGDVNATEFQLRSAGFLDRKGDGTLKAHREREELRQKLAALGLPVPWQ